MFNKNTFAKAMVAATLGAAMLLPVSAFAQTNPVPSISTISPSSVVAGSGSFTLTVNGSNFVSGSVVQLNSSGRATTFVSPNQLTAIINSSDVASPTTYNVTVFNPGPGGGTSNAVVLTVTPSGLVPVISNISPSSVVAGSGSMTLTVNGNNFVSGATVNFNGSPRPTSFISSTQLNATLSAADVSAAGTANITVTNPSPGGTSNQATLTITSSSQVNNPVPSLSSISPMSAPVGSAGQTLTVMGSGFVSNSVVNFNGLARPTTFVSPTQLLATIFASDKTIAGPQAVTVTNPSPGGGTSNAILFTVTGAAGTPTTPSTPGLPNTGFGPDKQEGIARLLTEGALAVLAAITIFGSVAFASRMRKAH